MLNPSSSETLFEVIPASPENRQAFAVFIHPPLPYETQKKAIKDLGIPGATIGNACNEFVLVAPTNQEAAEAVADDVVAYLVSNGLKAVRRDFMRYEGNTPLDEQPAA